MPFTLLVVGDYTVDVEMRVDGEAVDTDTIKLEVFDKNDPSLPDPDDLWADPVDASTGGDYINRTVFEVMGIKPLTFDMTYLSTYIYKAEQDAQNSIIFSEAGTNTMGSGWSHNYETWLDDNTNTTSGTIVAYWSPYRYTAFYNESGSLYTPRTVGMEGYTLNVNGDSTYELTCADKSKYYFNSSGELTKIEDRKDTI